MEVSWGGTTGFSANLVPDAWSADMGRLFAATLLVFFPATARAWAISADFS